MAKKFNFKLEPALKLRNYQAKQAKTELGRAVQARVGKENAIEENKKYKDDILKIEFGKQKIDYLQNSLSHRERIGATIEKLESEKKDLIEIESFRKKNLATVRQKEKAFENLKDKHKKIHLEKLDKEEQIVLDEIALKNVNKKL